VKKHYIICFEGGSNGNFIASLIRTMADHEYYKNYGNITSHGSCDHMSGGMRLSYDYVHSVFGHAIYPESDKNVKIVLDAVRDPTNTYEKFILAHEKDFDFDLTTIHYRKPDTVKQLLENQNVYVVYITFTENDLKLIATNFVYKIIEPGREKEDEKLSIFKGLLIKYQLTDDIEELEKTESLSQLSNSMLNKLINAHGTSVSLYRPPVDIEDHERLLKLPFNLMYEDKSAILKLLEKFTKLTANDSTYLLYENYMSAQQPILKNFK